MSGALSWCQISLLSQPIAIPALVASVEAEAQGDKTTLSTSWKEVCLQCVSCGKEKPYKIDEILEFDRSVTTVTPRAESTSTKLRGMENRSRAASA
jgi:hypothetical protein